MDLKYEALAVIIQATNGKCYQVALSPEEADSLYDDLRLYFNDGIVKILPKPLNEIKLEVPDENS